MADSYLERYGIKKNLLLNYIPIPSDKVYVGELVDSYNKNLQNIDSLSESISSFKTYLASLRESLRFRIPGVDSEKLEQADHLYKKLSKQISEAEMIKNKLMTRREKMQDYIRHYLSKSQEYFELYKRAQKRKAKDEGTETAAPPARAKNTAKIVVTAVVILFGWVFFLYAASNFRSAEVAMPKTGFFVGPPNTTTGLLYAIVTALIIIMGYCYFKD